MNNNNIINNNNEDEEFEKRGINIILLRAIRDLALIMNNEYNFWSIGAISAYMIGNHEILKPDCRFKDVNVLNCLTYNDKLSLINMLETHYNSDTSHPLLNVTYNQVVNKKSNVFISFAYTTNYIELVDAVENYLITENKDEKTTFFWFDVFVNNQWIAAEKSFQWWANTFQTAVQDIGETLLILTPWQAPLMLTRAWCLFEISCSKKISIGMSKDQNHSFLHELKTTTDSLLHKIFKIDLENADAWITDDKEKIFKVVRSIEGGFHKFNTIVMSLLNKWITNQLRKISFECVDSISTRLNIDQIKEVANAGLLYQQMGNYDEAYHSFKKVLTNLEQYYDLTPTCSEVYVQYIMTLNNLAINCRRRNKLNESETFFKLVIKNYESIFGFNHETTLESMGNYANCLRDLQRLGEAKEMYERVCKGLTNIFGENNHRTLRNLDNLANTISDQGLFEEAQPIYERVLKGYSVIGVEHLGYMDTLNNIAINLSNLKRNDEAIAYYEKSYKLTEQRFGTDNQETIKALQNFSNSLLRMNRPNDALPYFKKLVEILRNIGDSNCQFFEMIIEKILQEKTAEINHHFEYLVDDGFIDSNTSMTNNDRIQVVKAYKEKGSNLYKQFSCNGNGNDNVNVLSESMLGSIRYYNVSLDHLKKLVDDKNNEEIKNLFLTLYLNLAQCYLKLQAWDKCIEYCSLALGIDTGNSKALYRRGICHEAMKQFDLALCDFVEAKKKSNDSVIALAEKRVLKEHVKEKLVMNPDEYEQLIITFCDLRGMDSNSKSIFLDRFRQQVRQGDFKALNEGAKFLKSVIDSMKPGLSGNEKKMSEDMLINNLVESSLMQARATEATGNFERAKQEYEKVLDMQEANGNGIEDLRTVSTSLDYARVLSKLGLAAECNHICENILDKMTSKLGSSSEVIIRCMQLQKQNDHIDKKDFKPYQANYEIEKLTQLANIIYQLDTTPYKEGNHKLTMKVLEESKSNSFKKNQLGTIMNILLDVFRFPSYCTSVKISLAFHPTNDLKRLTEAVLKYQSSLQELDKEDIIDNQDERIAVGKYLEESGELEEAKSWFEKILTDYEEEFGLDHSKTDEASIHFGRIVFKMSNFAEAKGIYKRLISARESSLGSSHPTIVESRRGLELCQSAIDGDVQPASSTVRVTVSKYTRVQLEEWTGILQALHPNEMEGKIEYDRAIEYIKTATDLQLDELGDRFKHLLGIDELSSNESVPAEVVPPTSYSNDHSTSNSNDHSTSNSNDHSTSNSTSQSTSEVNDKDHHTEEEDSLLPLLSLLSIKETLELVKIFELESKAVKLTEKSEYAQLIFRFIKEKVGTGKHFESFLFQHAIYLKKTGNLIGARSYYTKLYEIQKQFYGSSSIDALTTANNLANVIFDIGVQESSADMLHEATQFSEENLIRTESVLGSLSHEYLTCCYNLAQNYTSLNRLDEARELYERSLSGRDKILGPMDPMTLDTVANLARIISRIALKCNDREKLQDGLKSIDEALVLFKRAFEGKMIVLGGDHKSTVHCKLCLEETEKIKKHLLHLDSQEVSQSEPPQQQQESTVNTSVSTSANTSGNYTRIQLEEWATVIKAITVESESEEEAQIQYEATMQFINNADQSQLNQLGDQMKILLNIIN